MTWYVIVRHVRERADIAPSVRLQASQTKKPKNPNTHTHTHEPGREKKSVTQDDRNKKEAYQVTYFIKCHILLALLLVFFGHTFNRQWLTVDVLSRVFFHPFFLLIASLVKNSRSFLSSYLWDGIQLISVIPDFDDAYSIRSMWTLALLPIYKSNDIFNWNKANDNSILSSQFKCDLLTLVQSQLRTH